MPLARYVDVKEHADGTHGGDDLDVLKRGPG
jgi:hypothetical protein